MKNQAEQWNYFVENGITEGSSNVKYDFSRMSKRFGKAFMEYIAAAYAAKGDMTDEEFCAQNGGVPVGFIAKIKPEPRVVEFDYEKGTKTVIEFGIVTSVTEINRV